MWLLKLHQKYLFNKVNLIIILFVMILSIVLGVILINPVMSDNIEWMYRDALKSNFEQSYLVFLKIIMILISSYLYCLYFSNIGDNYSIILICKTSKEKYFITKVFVINLMLLLFVIIFFVNYILIGFAFSKWFVVDYQMVKSFLMIFVISICYGYLSVIFIKILNSLYVVLIPFGLYLVSEIIIDFVNTSNIVRIIEMFLPTTLVINDRVDLVYGIFHLIFLSVLYFVFSFITYIKVKE